MNLGKNHLILHIPRSIHPWHWGRLPSRFYLGPIMIYRRRNRITES